MATHFDPSEPDAALSLFLRERHLATLTTLRSDGTPHVVPVGFTYEAARSMARIITFAGSRKVRNVREAPDGRVAICQVDGGRWVTLEGTARLRSDPDSNGEAVRRYAERYRQPKDRPDRVTIEVLVEDIMGRV